MRLDRIYSEGEAVIALRRLGFQVNQEPFRPGLYEVEHPDLGGSRTFTEEQICRFAEGVSISETLLKREATLERQA
jgi:hypothetical protein